MWLIEARCNPAESAVTNGHGERHVIIMEQPEQVCHKQKWMRLPWVDKPRQGREEEIL